VKKLALSAALALSAIITVPASAATALPEIDRGDACPPPQIAQADLEKLSDPKALIERMVDACWRGQLMAKKAVQQMLDEKMWMKWPLDQPLLEGCIILGQRHGGGYSGIFTCAYDQARHDQLRQIDAEFGNPLGSQSVDSAGRYCFDQFPGDDGLHRDVRSDCVEREKRARGDFRLYGRILSAEVLARCAASKSYAKFENCYSSDAAKTAASSH
jgi:hypothetical protein